MSFLDDPEAFEEPPFEEELEYMPPEPDELHGYFDGGTGSVELPVATPLRQNASASTSSLPPMSPRRPAVRHSTTTTGQSSSTPTSAAASSSGDSPPLEVAKRRRYSGKTSVPMELRDQSVYDRRLSPQQLAEHWCLAAYRKQPAAAARKVQSALRVRRQRLRERLRSGEVVEVGGINFQKSKDPAAMDSIQHQLMIAHLHLVAEDSELRPELRGCAMKSLLALGEGSVSEQTQLLEQKCLKNKSVLMTYQGDWGRIPHSDESQAHRRDLGSLIVFLKTHPQVVQLSGEITHHCEDLRKRHMLNQFAAALELCENTFAETGEMRLHIHVWMSKDTASVTLEDLCFKKATAYVNKDAMQYFGGRGSRSVVASYAGAFYLYVQKAGSLYKVQSVEPWKHYSVKDYWITTLYTAGKITADVARELYVRTVVRCEMNLKQLAYVEAEKLKLQAAAEQRRVEQHLRSQARAYRRVPEVELWSEQFAGEPRGRYKFLVLNGRSQTGKTRFARQLVAADRAWYCDCVAGVPDLRGYNRAAYDLIIFDEITAVAAMTFKKVLQSGPDLCTLAVSPTMQFTYSAVFAGCRMVCCSNTWLSTLKTLPKEDQDWLRENSIFVQGCHFVARGVPARKMCGA